MQREHEKKQEKIHDSLLLWYGKMPAHKEIHAVGERKMGRSMFAYASQHETC